MSFGIVTSEKLPQLVQIQLASSKDGAQQTWADVLTGMHGDNGLPPVGVAEHVMAALDSNDDEAGPLQRPHQVTPPDSW